MINQYLPLFILIAMAGFVGVFVLILSAVFGPHRPTQRKSETYESGMVPYGPGTRRISVKYYLVAVLFILFDVEVVFFLPWAVAMRVLGIPGFVIILVVAAILEVAFIYAWKKGALEWE